MRLEVNNLSKTIDDKIIFQDISFVLDYGQIKAILGANGSGKTSILRAIFLNYSLDSGEIIFDSKIQNRKGKTFNLIGISTQESRMYSGLSVLENINYFKSFYDIKINKKFNDEYYISKLQLEPFLNMHYGKLSTGNRQKADLLRSLIINPELIIWDEPFANVDLEGRISIKNLMVEMKNELNTSFLISTHEFKRVSSIIDSVIVLSDGKIKFIGTIEEFKIFNKVNKSKISFNYLSGDFDDSKNI